MNVKEIVEKFGGQTALANIIGKGQSTVAYWVKANSIPPKWHLPIMEAAAANGVLLAPSDFNALVPVSSPKIAVLPKAINIDTPRPINTSPTERSESPFLFYTSDDGTVKVHVVVEGESVWASQRAMGEIFSVDVSTISEHLGNIFRSEELDESAVVRKFRITASDGKMYETGFYNLDAIISVGYRVNSRQATQFRRWATKVLSGYLIKGYALDDERLKQGGKLFGKDYFDELLEKIREIRASERRFYQKITDIYAQCSVDYDKNSPISQLFYAHVQDKLHFAIHGHTAAELISKRADAAKPHMGLTAWKNEGRGGKVTKLDVTVGKNYLTQAEMDDLNRLVSMYLDWAENFARRQKALTMKDWAEKLNGFLSFNAYEVLADYGSVRREAAERRAHVEYEKFRVIQDSEFRSDFDKVVDEIKANKKING